ncbi:MAG: nitroreductase family protein [Clostridia bacterium]|nr:nitroreductase family protein [Clostridia bacterium]
MNVYETIVNRRTVRKFKQTPVKKDDLLKLINSARLCPTGANLQSLKYSVVTSEEKRKLFYPHLKYAGYIPDWDPSFEESPMAIIVVLNDNTIKPAAKAEADSGAAIMSMSLCAVELGLDTCWIGSANKNEIRKIMGYDDNLDILYVLAVGYADQEGEAFDSDETVKYYFDENLKNHVPKRTMESVLIDFE